MRETIEEMFRMYNIEPNDSLLDALELYVRHEKLNAEHEVTMRLMNRVNEITGRKEKE